MKKAIRTYARDFAAVIVLAVIAVAVGGYILTQQRLRFPVIEEAPKQVRAEFRTGQALTPGQGQTIRVSGVKIGDIAKVDLHDGRAVVTMDIDPKYADVVRTDATALLRPKTGLKDMFIEVDPGDGPVAPEGFTLPIQNTAPDVNLDELLAMLDEDTRQYVRLLVQGAGEGLKGRGPDLREVFRRYEPTHRDLARVTEKVAERRQNLRRLIHNLNRLNTEVARKDDELAQLVDSAARVFRAFASEDGNVTRAVEELPSALRQTTATLRKVETFATTLGPAVERLRPAVRKLDDANKAVTPLALEGAPILREEIRPFVRESRPFVRDLRPAADRLADATPDLTRTFRVINTFQNLLSFNRDGAEPAADARRDEGYLFWLAWLAHNGNNVFSTSQSTGIMRPVALQLGCETIRSTIEEEPEAEFLQGFTEALLDQRICPEGPDNVVSGQGPDTAEGEGGKG